MPLLFNQDKYLAALHFAAKAHAGQTVPGTALPYTVHLVSVAMETTAAIMAEGADDPDLAIQCALLHDAVEDTAVSLGDIESAFGAAVAAGVGALTKDAALPKPDAMRDSLERIRTQPREVWMVKLADRITNLQPPPSYWTAEKRAAYQAEARLILQALGAASPMLSKRLAAKIEGYLADPAKS